MAAEALAAHPMTKLVSRLFALTALRPGTLRTTSGAELEALNEDVQVWQVPADRTKLKVARKQDERFDFLVPLSRQAMDVFRAARAFATRGPLVFPSQRHVHKRPARMRSGISTVVWQSGRGMCHMAGDRPSRR